MNSPGSIDQLICSLGSRDERHRAWAAEHLVALGSSAVPHLVDALGWGRWLVRRGAILALERIHDPACLPAVRNCLDDGEADVRAAAIRIVGQFRDRHSVEKLHDELLTGMLDLRPTVIEALGRIRDPATAPLLCRRLEDLDIPASRHSLILWALQEIANSAVIPALCQYGGKQRGATATLVEETLVQIGARDIPILVGQLVLGDATAGAAAGALYRMGVSAFPALGRAAESSVPGLRIRARSILAAQGLSDLSWIEDLVAAVEQGPARVRTFAAEGLAGLADLQNYPGLRSALPALKRASGFWRGNSDATQRAIHRAIARIKHATNTIAQTPLPAGNVPTEALLPRPAAEPAIEGPLPMPAPTAYPSEGTESA